MAAPVQRHKSPTMFDDEIATEADINNENIEGKIN